MIRRFADRTRGARAVASSCCALLAACAAQATDPTFTEMAIESGIVAQHAPSALFEGGASILGIMSAGGSVGDFDNDGDEDIFIPLGGLYPDVLCINDGTGNFTNQAADWGVAVKHMGVASAVGDYDNDGWLDIFVTSGGPHGTVPGPGKHRLYRNSGMGHFDEVAQSAGVAYASPNKLDGPGAAFGDYDLDGDLDLFVAGWLVIANGNRLFRNNGDGTFTEVTAAAGLAVTGVRGFSPRFVDMNGDRYPELLLAADFGTSRYFKNNGDGTFTNITGPSGTGLDDNGMGHTVGDFDGDGLLDWFVTSIWSTGNPETPGTGNMLYRNLGGHLYDEIAVPSGVNNGNWGWGVSAVDLDNDSDLDLVQTLGWQVYPEFTDKPSRVWLNVSDRGATSFVDVATTCGLLHTLQGRGLLTFDADQDGDQDVVIFSNKEKARFYRNNLPHAEDAHWLRIKLDTSGAPGLAPNGAGAKVSFDIGSTILRRYLDTGTNFQAQNELFVHAGLGAATSADVQVDWPDGRTSVRRSVAANQTITISPDVSGDLDHDGTVGAADLGLLLAGWGPVDRGDERDFNDDGQIDGADLAVVLANWT